MFREGTIPWSLHTDLNIGINFCVWALQRDGLHVPPFDRHPVGDRSLQSAGLTAQLWQSWLTETVIGQRTPANPSLAPIGTPLLQQCLQNLWQTYLPTAKDWRKSSREAKLFASSFLEEQKNLWDTLKPFHQKLPELRIYYVQYPHIVSFLVPPISIVIGSTETALPSFETNEHILRAAKQLAREN